MKDHQNVMNDMNKTTTTIRKDPKSDTMTTLPSDSMVGGSDEKTAPGAISVGEYSDSTSPASDTTTCTTGSTTLGSTADCAGVGNSDGANNAASAHGDSIRNVTATGGMIIKCVDVGDENGCCCCVDEDDGDDRNTSSSCSISEIICDSGNDSSSRHHCPSVRFGDIEIREHAMILGDHPDAIDGPPLTIEWKSQRNRIDSVDNYEATRKNRRHEWDLRVTPTERNMYLRRVVGVPSEDIYRATFRAEDDRKKRIDTIKGQKNEKFDIFVQSLQRKTMRLLNRTTHPGKLLKSRGAVSNNDEGTSNIDLILQTHKIQEQHRRRHTIHDIPTFEPPPPPEETLSTTKHKVSRENKATTNSSPRLMKPVLKKALHNRSSTL